MPFVRFSRDKRGYEHTYLVHESASRGRASRARVLYWFRTPPGIKIGREPFDEGARRQIEAQNPGISFDWNAIASTPMPPVPEVEHWRERRRVERAAKVARREEEQENERVETAAVAPAALTVAEPVALEVAAETATVITDVSLPVEDAALADATPAQDPEALTRKRRRRRGGRRRRPGVEAASGVETDGEAEDGPSEDAAAVGTSERAALFPDDSPDGSPGDTPSLESSLPCVSPEPEPEPASSAPAGRAAGASEE